ncbi:CoA-binding protein [Acuticoccus sp.]|uniref:CoA-binding protein n=1 Tax=Acuticoccus sp. TaxID=1904378 RepID=UPI003B525AA5
MSETSAAHHERYDDALVETILAEARTIAMVGASANPNRPSSFVMRYLMDKGYEVHPINPGHAGGAINGRTAYATLADVPIPVDMVDVFRASDAVPGIVDELLALERPPKVLWLQLGVRNDAAAARAETAGVTVIQNRCPKIEYGRLSGEISWAGVNSRRMSARRPSRLAGFQHLGLAQRPRVD